MESLIASQKKWERQNGLEKTIEDVQRVIDLIAQARDEVAADISQPTIALTKLESPIKDSFDRLDKDAKELHASITNYGKLLEKKFKPTQVPQASVDQFATHTHLTNRAIGMHLLREGMFDVASSFVGEATKHMNLPAGTDVSKFWAVDGMRQLDAEQYDHDDSDEDMEEDVEGAESNDLHSSFTEMYQILHTLRNERNLEPAIAWANTSSDALEARGSNLEFELCRLRFVELYHGEAAFNSQGGTSGPLQALEYARATFPNFSRRYFKETAQLMGSLAYSPSITSSPYRKKFFDATAWEEVASSFTREFCGLLGLSEKSPLYTAVTAGGIAMPVLEKLERVMGESGGQWSSANELPVEIPLPPAYLFHSIFVCPVSKEQTTDLNPPMMMTCGHVIAKESMDKISRGTKFKCHLCPSSNSPRDAKRVYF